MTLRFLISVLIFPIALSALEFQKSFSTWSASHPRNVVAQERITLEPGVSILGDAVPVTMSTLGRGEFAGWGIDVAPYGLIETTQNLPIKFDAGLPPGVAISYCPVFGANYRAVDAAETWTSDLTSKFIARTGDNLYRWFTDQPSCSPDPNVQLSNLGQYKSYFVRVDLLVQGERIRGRTQAVRTRFANYEHGHRFFYVDPLLGNDAFSGDAPNRPWKSLEHAFARTYSPGDHLLLRSGTEFEVKATLDFKGSGTADKPVFIDAYGAGALPKLVGTMSQGPILKFINISGIEVSNLEMTYANLNDMIPLGAAIYMEANKDRTVKYLKSINVSGLWIHDVPGVLPKEVVDNVTGYTNGGIIINSESSSNDRAAFDFVSIVDNIIEKVDRVGITLRATNNTYNQNVLVMRNLVDHPGGDGIYLDGIEDLENLGLNNSLRAYGNLVNGCCNKLYRRKKGNVPDGCGVGSANTAGAALWTRHTKGYKVSNNLIANSYLNADGMAMDADEYAFQLLFQNNISYNNNGGWMAIFAKGGDKTEQGSTNGQNVVQSNISIDDARIDQVIDFPGYGDALSQDVRSVSCLDGRTFTSSGLDSRQILGFYNDNPMGTGIEANTIVNNTILFNTYPERNLSMWPKGLHLIGNWGGPRDFIFKNNTFHLGSGYNPNQSTIANGFEFNGGNNKIEYNGAIIVNDGRCTINGKILDNTMLTGGDYPNYDAYDFEITQSNKATKNYSSERIQNLNRGHEWFRTMRPSMNGMYQVIMQGLRFKFVELIIEPQRSVIANDAENSLEMVQLAPGVFTLPPSTPLGHQRYCLGTTVCTDSVEIFHSKDWVAGQTYQQGDSVTVGFQICRLNTTTNAGWSQLSPNDPVLWAVWSCRLSQPKEGYVPWEQGVTYSRGDVVLDGTQICELKTQNNAGWASFAPSSPLLHSVWQCTPLPQQLSSTQIPRSQG
jgi:hypothetical protein